MGFRQIDIPVIYAPAISVIHFLLLAVHFTGDKKLAVQL
jgi:hypothetical protein